LIVPMKLALVTHLTIDKCQQLLADPRTFEGSRLRGDTFSGGALDLVNPSEFRVKWRWGPFHPFLFAATLTRDEGMTRIEGRLTPHFLFEVMSLVPVVSPELIILIIFVSFMGLTMFLAFALRYLMSPLATWFLAAGIILAGMASMIVAGRRLYRHAQNDVLRLLQDAFCASPGRT
jgi:hypothetical protein